MRLFETKQIGDNNICNKLMISSSLAHGEHCKQGNTEFFLTHIFFKDYDFFSANLKEQLNLRRTLGAPGSTRTQEAFYLPLSQKLLGIF